MLKTIELKGMISNVINVNTRKDTKIIQLKKLITTRTRCQFSFKTVYNQFTVVSLCTNLMYQFKSVRDLFIPHKIIGL